MSDFENPAIAALAKRIDPQLTWGQVHIRRIDDGGELQMLKVVGEDNADMAHGGRSRCCDDESGGV